MLVGNNQDLLLEILSLLPTKYVIRFKGVSKLWQSIISDSYFIKTHINNNCNPQAISGFTCSDPEDYIHYYYLFDGSLSSAPDLSLSILKHDAAESLRIPYNFSYKLHVYVSRSFYGLLICPVMWISECRFSLKLIYIFNPVTMQYRRISEVEPNWCPLDMILTPDHNLIILSSDDIYFHQIRIYCNNTQSWKIMYTFEYDELNYNQPTKGIFLNGRVYWDHQIGYTLTRSIFSLNVESFQVKTLAWPDYCDDFYRETLYFGECGGRLHLVMEQKIYDFIFHIMEIKEDFSGWNHLHCIDLKFMRDILPSPALSPALARKQTIKEERDYNEEDDRWDYIEMAYEGEDHASAIAPIQMVLGEGSEDYELLFTMTLPKFDHNRLRFVRRAVPRIFSYNITNKISYREIMNATDTGRFYTAAQINTYYPMLTTP